MNMQVQVQETDTETRDRYSRNLIAHLLEHRDLMDKIDFEPPEKDLLGTVLKILARDRNTSIEELSDYFPGSTVEDFQNMINEPQRRAFKECKRKLKGFYSKLQSMDRHQQEADRLRNDILVNKFEDTDDSLHYFSYRELLKKFLNNEFKPVKGVKFGLKSIDKLIDILPEGTTTIIGGTPGTGKTMFCLNRAIEWARDGKRVLFVTLELVVRRLMECTTAMILNKPRKELTPNIMPVDLVDKYAPDNLFFLDGIGMSGDKLIESIENYNFDVLIIDHIQLLAVSEDRRLAIDRAVLDLRKEVTKRGAILILISQLNTAKLSGNIPGLDAFKESGMMAQDASCAITLYSTQGDFLREGSPAKLPNPFSPEGGKKTIQNAEDIYNKQMRELYAEWVVRVSVVKARDGKLGNTDIILDRNTGNYYDPYPLPLQEKIKEINNIHIQNKLAVKR